MISVVIKRVYRFRAISVIDMNYTLFQQYFSKYMPVLNGVYIIVSSSY